jgi:ATP-dependent RNA helicase DeaD
MDFENISPLLSGALTARGYAAPTPVQARSSMMRPLGRDLVVSAQTGSGKTVAFGLAMADASCSRTGACRPRRSRSL